MARTVDHAQARQLLESEIREAEAAYSSQCLPPVPPEAAAAAQKLFESKTQSYREALLGCAVVRVLDPQIDISLPYAGLGTNAFGGRSLDEQVINPFLKERQIPCSRGPYLAVFRRSVPFDETTVKGLKDKDGYRAFLAYLDELKKANADEARMLLRYLLFKFVDLRERSGISVIRPRRVSLSQWPRLLDELLSKPSGGQVPVLLAVALLKAVNETYQLGWQVEWQPINVADAPSQAAGDITVREGGQIRLALEVTERPVDEHRVRSTFRDKIGPHSVQDFLFVFSREPPNAGARQQAAQYLLQDYEIGFVPVKEWIVCNLSLAGVVGRKRFLEELLSLLEQCSAIIKRAWNEAVEKVLGHEASLTS